jgi:hypothetical protein
VVHELKDHKFIIPIILLLCCGRDSVVGTATRWGLHEAVIKSQRRRNFACLSDGPRGQPSFMYRRYRVFPEGKAAGAWCWPPTPRLQSCWSYNFISPLCLHRHAIRWHLHLLLCTIRKTFLGQSSQTGRLKSSVLNKQAAWPWLELICPSTRSRVGCLWRK